MLDEFVINLKQVIAGTAGQPPVDQTQLYYQLRKAGPDYLPPFSIGNWNYCQGEASDVDDGLEVDKTFILVTTPRLRDTASELMGDTGQFATHDFGKYEFEGELLNDDQIESNNVRVNTHKRRKCQAINPNTGEHYAEPYEYWELVDQKIYPMENAFRH